MTLEHATHTTYKITRFDSEEWLNYNKKERSKPLKNEPNCLKPASNVKVKIAKYKKYMQIHVIIVILPDRRIYTNCIMSSNM